MQTAPAVQAVTPSWGRGLSQEFVTWVAMVAGADLGIFGGEDFISRKRFCQEDFSGVVQSWAWDAMRGRHTFKCQLTIMNTPVGRLPMLSVFLAFFFHSMVYAC